MPQIHCQWLTCLSLCPSWSPQDIQAFYSSLTCFKSLDELFPQATTVFMVGSPYYGAMGEVCPISMGNNGW